MKIIAVDADGTLWTNKWPEIGVPDTYLMQYLINCRKVGIKVILLTMREGELLDKAVECCKQHGLEFDAVNDNLPEMIEYFGSNPRKVYANWYIDDCVANVRGLGRPLPALDLSKIKKG